MPIQIHVRHVAERDAPETLMPREWYYWRILSFAPRRENASVCFSICSVVRETVNEPVFARRLGVFGLAGRLPCLALRYGRLQYSSIADCSYVRNGSLRF